MKRSTERILTTHTGSLPRPDGLVDRMLAQSAGRPIDDAAFQGAVRGAVDEIVKQHLVEGKPVDRLKMQPYPPKTT